MKKILISLVLLAFITAGFSAPKEMEYEKEYLPKLNRQKERLVKYEKNIAEENTKIAGLNESISSTEGKTDAVWNEIYAIIESDKAGVDSYRTELESLDKEVKGFGALPAEELYKRKAELDALQAKVDEYRKSKISYLTEFVNKLSKIEQNIKSIRSSIVVPYVTSYVVVSGDNLWKISGKKDIYDDPFKWTDIYKANKETIKSWQSKFNATLKEGQNEEDLIYPDQEFTIPR